MSASDSSTHQQHQQHARQSVQRDPIACAVLTISDTRTLQTDVGGTLVVRHVEMAGHAVAARELVPDDAMRIESMLRTWLENPAIDVILCTGGTGIARRDTTIEVVRRLLTAELEGFGELFRSISFQHVGAAAMLSRAVGGLVAGAEGRPNDTFIFAMPGSPNAVEVAMSQLIAPQLAHLVWERRR